MLFNEFGSKENPAVLLMHGMLQDWHSIYEMLEPLQQHYRIIIPAMDGMYPGSADFTSFAEQCRQMESFIAENYNGRLHGAYGISQGATVLSELIARGNIDVGQAVLDGVYVAHQGNTAAWFGILTFRKVKRSGGKFPKSMGIVMQLMGLSEKDLGMFSRMYWDASDITLKRNLLENYNYRANPELRSSNTKVYLWCGSRESYALKSHRILKKYLRNYEEEVFPDMGHGQMLLYHREEICTKLRKVFG